MAERILLVDDQPDLLEYLTKLLKELGYEVIAVPGGEEAVEAVRKDQGGFWAAALDLNLAQGKMDGPTALREIRALAPDLPVVLLSGMGMSEAAVRALRLALTDFVEKGLTVDRALPASLDRLRSVVRLREENHRLHREVEALKGRAEFLRARERERNRIVGEGPAIRRMLEEVRAAGPGAGPVLIRGERGAGKDLVAAALHDAGDRPHGPFLQMSAAALPGPLLERELFGYEKGAFAGASLPRIGRIEQAAGGTLFLDDVGHLPADLQERLVLLLDHGELRRIGGTEGRRADTRLLAGTSDDLEARVAAGAFRPDLHSRIARRVIRVPPLRERPEDIPALVEHFAEMTRRSAGWAEPCAFPPDVLARLREHPWPGNVRELQNVVERMALSCAGRKLRLSDLPAELLLPAGAGTRSLPDLLEAVERRLVLQAMDAAGGDVAEAAAGLGVTPERLAPLLEKRRPSAGEPAQPD